MLQMELVMMHGKQAAYSAGRLARLALIYGLQLSNFMDGTW